ncbi:chemotaxis protein CheX [Geobacter sp. AOG2]|uniref:chemotaxis protein CheX n=1 Tax=Geobacter sp. AOG2 TaxID=1566347 RepID=UPI001CC4336B|nr:chemotaxis protein CheX [Geobacter sp. AOG2]GFE60343.1 chemotaxis protein CheX [Geobacter sp. AOG2]
MSLTKDLLDILHTSEDKLLKQLTRDVEEVFCTMVGMEDLLHLPLQVAPETHFKDCITAMVGFAGVYNGLVSLHAPQQLALAFTSSMLGMEISNLNDDVRDALGEIANMIAGSFKQHISRGGADIKLSTPSIVSGDDYFVNAGNNHDTLTLRFATDKEWFIVAIVLEKA